MLNSTMDRVYLAVSLIDLRKSIDSLDIHQKDVIPDVKERTII